jgi:hypothetical protein
VFSPHGHINNHGILKNSLTQAKVFDS